MADRKITDLPDHIDLEDGDRLESVDTSDATESPEGTSKSPLLSAVWTYIKAKTDALYATITSLNAHIGDSENPHNVTAAQAGADPVGSAAAVQSNLDAHTGAAEHPYTDGLGQVWSNPQEWKSINLQQKANSSDTIRQPRIFVQTTEPPAAEAEDGDIWIVLPGP